MRLYFLLLLVFLVSGCATLSEEECAVINWEQLGYGEGLKGYALVSRLKSHARSCGKYGIQPDADAFTRGYKTGLVSYCKKDAYQLGLSGSAYRGVCDAQFTQSYRSGREIYDMEQRIESMRSSIAKLERKMEESEDSTEKANYQSDIRRLEKDRKRLIKLLALKKVLSGRHGLGDAILDAQLQK